MEYLDVLDENGNETGKNALRSEIHSRGYWHKTVHIYIYRIVASKVELLVHLRSAKKDSSPNMWDTRFGGHVKSGASVEQTVLSELDEEIGLVADQSCMKKSEIVKYDGNLNREFAHIYFYKYDGDIEELNFKDEEVQGVKWMTFEDIANSVRDNSMVWAGGKMEKLFHIKELIFT